MDFGTATPSSVHLHGESVANAVEVELGVQVTTKGTPCFMLVGATTVSDGAAHACRHPRFAFLA